MVHQYQLNGYNIVLDSCSGSIHVVDEVAYDVIALYESKTADQIVAELLEKYADRQDVTEEELRLCIRDVEALKNAGKLFTPDTFADMAGTFKERSGDVVKALCLLLCKPGKIPRRPGGHELRGGQAGAGLPGGQLRPPHQFGGGLLRR